MTLGSRGIVINQYFRPAFQPQKPLAQKFLTREDADKALAQTRAWIARTVEPEHSFSHGGPQNAISGFANDEKTIRSFSALGVKDMKDMQDPSLNDTPMPPPRTSRGGLPCYLVGGTQSQRIDEGC